MVAATISGRLRRWDMVARWGGEEFAPLLIKTDIATTLAVLEGLRRTVAAQRMDCGPSTTISIGAGQAKAGEDIDSLLQRVDAALYRAKAAGRNRVGPA